MKKRIIAMLLSICLLFSLLPLGVVAVDESYGISEDGTVETPDPEATDPEETEPEADKPTVYEQMMAAETADDVYTILLADQQAAAVLTAEEINALIAKVEALPADDSKEELLETLNALPNALTEPVNEVDPLSDVSIDLRTSGTSEVTLNETAYLTNTTVITAAQVAENAYIEIYAKPGMAIGFASGTTWPGYNGSSSFVEDNYTSHKYQVDTNGDGIWEWDWYWLSPTNYAIINSTIKASSFSFTLTSGSNSCTVTIKLADAPTLVQNTLEPGSRYAIKELPITLYNYDGKLFNQYHANQNKGGWLRFNHRDAVPAGMTTYWGDANLPNSGSISTGIMQKTLVNGVPVTYNPNMNTDFFSTTEFSGKKVYENVKFQYIYDKYTGYYTYSSNLNHAQFDSTNNIIRLYNQTLSPQISKDEQCSNSGFYPFNNINGAYVNADYHLTSTDTQENVKWQDALYRDFFLQDAMYSIATYGEDTKTSVATSPTDMHFGLQMKVDFYMPVGRQVDANGDGNKENLIYTFTGDDDLWVYIDNTLVLDIGGAHTHVSGTIDFTNRTVTLGNSANVVWKDGTYVKEGASGEQTLSFEQLGINIQEDAMHTMQVFYLERWSGVSNCRMQFNLPLIPTNSVLVSKEVTAEDGTALNVTPDVDYTFKIYANNSALANKNYSIAGTNNVYRTDADGKFTLKAGQTAVFAEIASTTKIYLIEEYPNGVTYEYTGAYVSTNDQGAVKYTFGQETTVHTMTHAGSITFDFTNYMQTQDLTIGKELVDEKNAVEAGTSYSFNAKINGTNFAGKAVIAGEETQITDGTIALKAGQTAVIENIPKNMTYSVSESMLPEAPSGYKYLEPEYNGSTTAPSNVALTENTTITVKNTLVPMLGNLVITKSGIESADHHAKTSTTEEEFQSVIFNVNGTSNSGVAIDMDVVVHIKNDGKGSVIIKDIPVGSYTVTEKEDWSWRYNPDASSQKTAVVADEETTTSAFANTRDKTKWLNGDNYTTNIFDVSSITKKTGFAS